MVGCAVIGCSNRSDPHPGHASSIKVSLYQLPALFDQNLKDFELRKKHLAGYLAAISRDDINPASLEEHDYRVCSRHFVSGKPAGLTNVNNLDWLPTLHMEHSKWSTGTQCNDTVRYERAKERE